MKNMCLLILLFVLAFAWICNIQLAHAQTGLELYNAGFYPTSPDVLHPLNVYAQVHNPDTVGHNYKIRVIFETYEQSQNGYVNAGEGDTILFSFLPTYYGNSSIGVFLWSDYYSVGEGRPSPDIQEKVMYVMVGQNSPWSYTQSGVDSLNAKVQSLEAEISGLYSITNALTAGIISLLVVTIVVAVVAWWVTKKRTESAMQSKE